MKQHCHLPRYEDSFREFVGLVKNIVVDIISLGSLFEFLLTSHNCG